MNSVPTVEAVKLILSSPLFDIFVMIEMERQRSLLIHGPWDNYTIRAMSAVIKGEVSELDIAIEMDDMTDAKKELIHTATTACKAHAELTRRGR